MRWEIGMNVSELIEQLQKLPPDSIVIMQKDSEGNHYSPLCSVDGNAVYFAETDWSGEVYDLNWSAEDVGCDEVE